MVNRFAKHVKVILSEHFTSAEFDCHCTRQTCNVTLIDTVLVEALEELRKLTGPLTINSGFRCNAHNIDEGGSPGSFHMRGRAADVSKKGVPGFRLARLAGKIPVFANGGIGIYRDRAHVDTRTTPARWGLATLC